MKNSTLPASSNEEEEEEEDEQVKFSARKRQQARFAHPTDIYISSMYVCLEREREGEEGEIEQIGRAHV